MNVNVQDALDKALAAGQPCVLATVVAVAGAAPGKVSFKMLVMPGGKTIGTVGGGSLEAAAIRDALSILTSGQSALKTYDLEQIGMCCGGSATLFFDYYPAARTLLIFGGGHCGQALYQMAPSVGFRVLVYDNRPEVQPQFSSSDFMLGDFDQLPFDNFPDAKLYAVIMTYNHQYDYTVLRQLLSGTKPFEYIGLIGSAHKVREIRQQLASDNLTLPPNFYSPIGLNIGAQTPAEIAVAILGEIIAVIHDVKADFLGRQS